MTQSDRFDVGHVMIVGMGRSGSTYLEGSLASRFGGVAVGEVPGTWGAWQRPDKLCSCGQRARECEFWSVVGERYEGFRSSATAVFMSETNKMTLPLRSIGAWSRAIRLANNSTASRYARYLDEMTRLYEALSTTAADAGYRVVVDSSKHPLWYHLANRGRALAAYCPRRAIRIVRHPRAVAFSLQRPGSELTASGTRVIQRSYTLKQAIPYWLIMNLAGDAAAGKDSLFVRYEDLGDETYVDDLVSNGFELRESDTRQAWSHQLVGNPSRQASNTRLFSEDLRWRDASKSRVDRLIWKVLWPALHRYGYTTESTR